MGMGRTKRTIVILQVQYPTLSLGTTFRSEQLREILETEGYWVTFISEGFLGSGNFISKYGKRFLYSRVGSFALLMILSGAGVIWTLLGEGTQRKLKGFVPDVLVVEGAAAGVLLLQILERIKVPLIIDVQEIWEEELPYDWSILKSLIHFQVQRLLQKSYKVLVPSELARRYLTFRFRVNPNKIVVIPLCSTCILPTVYPRSQPPRIVYAGQLSREKHAELFVDSIPYVVSRRPETEFYVTNSGDLIPALKSMAKKCGAKLRLFFHNSYNNSRMLSEIATCSVGVLTLPYNYSYKIFPSAKFILYCAAGIPTVANNIGGWCSVIAREKIGLLTDDSPKEFAEALITFIDDTSLSLICGTKAQHFLRRICNKETLGKILRDIF